MEKLLRIAVDIHTLKVYGKALTQKIKKSEFEKRLKVVYLNAIVDIADTITNDHKTQPFNCIGEILGELAKLGVMAEKKINKDRNDCYMIPKGLEEYIK